MGGTSIHLLPARPREETVSDGFGPTPEVPLEPTVPARPSKMPAGPVPTRPTGAPYGIDEGIAPEDVGIPTGYHPPTILRICQSRGLFDSMWMVMMAGDGESKNPKMAPARPDSSVESSLSPTTDRIGLKDSGGKATLSPEQFIPALDDNYDLDALAGLVTGPPSGIDGAREFIDVKAKISLSDAASGIAAACVAGVMLAFYLADDIFPAGPNDDIYIAPTWARLVDGLQLAWQSL